jgi:hypothetical protein
MKVFFMVKKLIKYALITSVVAIPSFLSYDIYQKYIGRSWHKTVQLDSPSFFTPKISYSNHEKIEFKTHNPNPSILTVSRFAQTLEKTSIEAPIAPFLQSTLYSYWKGLKWKTNHTLDASQFKPGIYLAELSDPRTNKNFKSSFIVKPKKKTKVAVVASTNTWQAYNNFAGLSNYDLAGLPFYTRMIKLGFSLFYLQIHVGDRHYFPSTPLPTERPNEAIHYDLIDPYAKPVEMHSHLIRAEWQLIQFLEKHKMDYGVFSDEDIAFSHLPFESDVIIFNTHSEYWSEEMIGQLRSYLEKGGKVIFLSGNNIYRVVQFYNPGISVKTFHVDKNFIADLIGSGYDAYGYQTYAPFEVCDASHFVFEGTQVKNGSLFGFDNKFPNHGASGYETDKISSASSHTKVLAVGKNKEGPAYITFKDYPNNGWVFNFGSVSASPWINIDPVMEKMVLNLIHKASN